MLLVDTYLDVSTIENAGIGCFSNQSIKEGDKIWEFNKDIDQVYTENDFSKMSKLEKEFITKYSFMYDNKYYLCVDNARFFNHSNENYNTYDPPHEFITYAKRNINKGEEILSDYAAFGINEKDLQFNKI